jgi:hypothetical protein
MRIVISLRSRIACTLNESGPNYERTHLLETALVIRLRSTPTVTKQTRSSKVIVTKIEAIVCRLQPAGLIVALPQASTPQPFFLFHAASLGNGEPQCLVVRGNGYFRLI